LFQRLVNLFKRLPWLGWVLWVAFCILAVARTTPRRFGSTLDVYLAAAGNFWNERQIYDLKTIDNYLYWPISLVPLRPLLGIDHVASAVILTVVSALVLSFASIALMRALSPPEQRANALPIAGILLLVNISAAWFNFKYVQAQIIMTAGMMLACSAMIRERWRWASFWLFVSVVMKPLSIVMILLSFVLQPRMRIGLIVVLVLGFALPFAFVDAGYLIGQYQAWLNKLWLLSSAKPADWSAQADFASMLDSLGIVLPSLLSLAIRLAGALGTLFLAWRVTKTEGSIASALAVSLLSCCYITLFGPRNENISFLVITPFLTALALILIVRRTEDPRGWLLVAVTLILGTHWTEEFDRVVKPALVCGLYSWMAWLTLTPGRWRELVMNGRPFPLTQPTSAEKAID
jgi:hypothetical protein